MKTKLSKVSVYRIGIVLGGLLGLAPAWAGTEGSWMTFYGQGAGASTTGWYNTFVGDDAGNINTTGVFNTFMGHNAGYSNLNGDKNTFIGGYAGYWNNGAENTFMGYSAGYWNRGANNTFMGSEAGYWNQTGGNNTFIGYFAGHQNNTGGGNTSMGYSAGTMNAAGSRNVFLGYGAGYFETGSNRLYIDSCHDGVFCSLPFIYGEFDNHLLKINGVVGVSANSVAKSQLHFSLSDTDTGGWLTSVLDNNFFMSSGAAYDAAAGGWIQKSADTNAVIAGSGRMGYRIFTNTGATVGATFTPVARLHIDYAGNLGINTLAVAGVPIYTGTGAYLSAGGVWTSVSSRAAKENIKELTTADALRALAGLNPVTYNYKVDAQEKHVGFIAEDVPELVASKDRKGLSALDIVAVLTKVVQEKSQMVDEQRRAHENLVATVNRLEAELNRLKNRDVIAQR